LREERGLQRGKVRTAAFILHDHLAIDDRRMRRKRAA